MIWLRLLLAETAPTIIARKTSLVPLAAAVLCMLTWVLLPVKSIPNTYLRDEEGKGICGMGPKFCGDGCTSDCGRKSDCDAGWGMQWSKAGPCPLNVCCSEFGFCGTTQDFCRGKTVTSPSCSASAGSANKRIIGYYEGWNYQRSCDSKLLPP